MKDQNQLKREVQATSCQVVISDSIRGRRFVLLDKTRQLCENSFKRASREMNVPHNRTCTHPRAMRIRAPCLVLPPHAPSRACWLAKNA